MINSKTISWQSPLYLVLGSNTRYNHQVFEVSSEKKILNCVTLLSDRRAFVTDTDSIRTTPLHLTASLGIPIAIFLQILDEVLREGIDRVNNQGWTPLYSVCCSFRPQVGSAKYTKTMLSSSQKKLQALLEKGANPLIISSRKITQS
jgi:hypothetical protein